MSAPVELQTENKIMIIIIITPQDFKLESQIHNLVPTSISDLPYHMEKRTAILIPTSAAPLTLSNYVKLGTNLSGRDKVMRLVSPDSSFYLNLYVVYTHTNKNPCRSNMPLEQLYITWVKRLKLERNSRPFKKA